MQARCLVMLLCMSVALAISGFYNFTYRHHIPATGYADFDTWRRSMTATYANDFGELQHYREDNKKLEAEPAGNDRVVFFGDSIIEYWKLADTFPDKSYINRGIRGQSTRQLLVRFQQDVVELHPKVAIILATNNDIAGTTGPMLDEEIHANYNALSDMARQNGIRLVFISMLPVHNYTAKSQEFFAQRPNEKIDAVNVWLKQFCAAKSHMFVDLNTVLKDPSGMLNREYAKDGLHPEMNAYSIMGKHLQPVIDQALSQPPVSVGSKEDHRVSGD